MKLKNALTRLAFFLIAMTAAQSQSFEKMDPNYKNSELNHLKEIQQNAWQGVPKEKSKGWKYLARWEYFWGQRLFPDMKMGNAIEAYNKVIKDKSYKKDNSLQSVTWNLLGPTTAPKDLNGSRAQGLGRINVVRFSPVNPQEIWVGTAGGGVWRTTNKGKNWTSFPYTQFLSLGVSDIAISQSNPDIVYVATGDADGTVGSADAYYSIGIIKTTDAGNTWQLTNLSFDLSESVSVNRILVNPINPDIVVASTNKGIFKSTDGGNTWNITQNGHYRDMEFKPDNFDFMYAASNNYGGDNKIIKSTDAGNTWQTVHTVSNVNRIVLAVTPANVNNVYALCSSSKTNGFHSFRVSTDAGISFDEASNRAELGYNTLGWYNGDGTDTSGQSSYDLCLAVSPTSEDRLFTGGVNVWGSSDMGVSFNKTTAWYEWDSEPFIHADQHDLQYNPLTKELYAANDGGIYYTADNGNNWTDISDGLSIMQFYKMGQSTTNEKLIVAGAQDNGSNLYTSTGWKKLNSGDGMDCAIDPKNDNIMYCSQYNGSFFRTLNGGNSVDYCLGPYITGENGDWVTPFAVDPNVNKRVYAGYTNLWRNDNNGSSSDWKAVSNFGSSGRIDVISIAPSNSNYIYLAIDGIIKFTPNGGTTWNTLFVAPRFVTSITVDPNDPVKFWIGLSGFSPSEKVYYYDGTKLINLSGNLPNVPVNTIICQKNTPNRVYVGTDAGVYYSDYLSNIWTEYSGSNLPNIIVNELEIFYGSTTPKLRAATYGRGIWETQVLTTTNNPVPLSYNGTALVGLDSFKFCKGDFIEVKAGDGFSNYVWSDGTLGQTIKISNAGVYSVSATNDAGNTKSSSFEVFVEYANPIAITNKVNSVYCIGDTVELTATLGFNEYKWSTGETARKIKVSNSCQVYVIGKKDTPCPSYSDTLNIVFNPYPEKPVITIDNKVLSTQTAAHYQWYLDGALLKNDTNQTLNVKNIGKYTVEIKNEFLCSMMSDTFLVTEDMGIDDNNIGVYPNPSSGEFNLNISGYDSQSIEFTVTNTLGSEIMNYSGVINEETFKKAIMLNSYPSGIYFLNLKVGDNRQIIKLIKQ